MKMLLKIGLLLFVPLVSGQGLTNQENPSILALSDSVTEFSQKMYSEISKSQNGNFLFSPLSLHTAITLLNLGATQGSATQAELLTILSGFLNIEALVQAYREILQVYTAGSLRYGNKIWIEDRVSALPEYITRVRNLNTEVDTVDFTSNRAVSAINAWVDQLTGGQIDRLVEDVDSSTRLVIANALYLQEQWASAFNDQADRTAFMVDQSTSRNITMMERKESDFYYGRFRFGSEDYPHEIVTIPYSDSEFEMQIILPNKRFGSDGLLLIEDELERQLKRDSLSEPDHFNLFRSAKFAARKSKLHLRLPKFKIEADIDATNLIQNLGANLVFTDQSELGRISDAEFLRVNKIVHKAKVSVDLNGTEAAAATFIAIVPLAADFGKMRKVTVDRPFLFMVYDKKNKIPILVGRVLDPGTS